MSTFDRDYYIQWWFLPSARSRIWAACFEQADLHNIYVHRCKFVIFASSVLKCSDGSWHSRDLVSHQRLSGPLFGNIYSWDEENTKMVILHCYNRRNLRREMSSELYREETGYKKLLKCIILNLPTPSSITYVGFVMLAACWVPTLCQHVFSTLSQLEISDCCSCRQCRLLYQQ